MKPLIPVIATGHLNITVLIKSCNLSKTRPVSYASALSLLPSSVAIYYCEHFLAQAHFRKAVISKPERGR